MACFAVVEVFLDYDHVEDVIASDSFSSREEATAFIVNAQADNVAAWRARREYISRFVDTLKIPPSEDEVAFRDFLKGTPLRYGNIDSVNVRGMLKVHLNSSFQQYPKMEGYDPPFATEMNSMFVVEIPNCTKS